MAQVRQSSTIIWLLSLLTNIVFAKQRISVTAPMSSVDEGGVLAIHCRVWNLAKTEEVTILRKLKDSDAPERLSLTDGLVSGAGDRFFLAVRQLDDASNVYFLSIMDVTRQDEGEYTCYIVSIGGFTEIASDSVTVSVFYLPSENYPMCKGYDNTLVKEGSIISLNCSSEVSNSDIDITWSRVGTDITFPTTKEIHNGILYSSMILTTRLQDSGSVFLCTISSAIFPGEIRTCHLGPVNVIPNDGSKTEQGNVMGNARGTYPTVSTYSVTKYTRELSSEKMREKCQKTCSSISSSSFFWIVATAVSAILAVLFGIIGVVLLIRYHRKTKMSKTQYMAARRVPEEIYSELENRRMSSKFYMTLVKPETPKNLLLQDKRLGQYNMKPSTHPLNA